MDGYFNGDPHPGNLLVVRDRATRDFKQLALVDYGQVKSLTREQRLALARLIVALSRADPSNPALVDRIASIVRSMGLATEKNNPYVQFKLAQIGFDRDDPLVTNGLNLQAMNDAPARRRSNRQHARRLRAGY